VREETNTKQENVVYNMMMCVSSKSVKLNV